MIYKKKDRTVIIFSVRYEGQEDHRRAFATNSGTVQ